VTNNSELRSELPVSLGLEADSRGSLLVQGRGSLAKVQRLTVGSERGGNGRIELKDGGLLEVTGSLEFHTKGELVISALKPVPITVNKTAALAGSLQVDLTAGGGKPSSRKKWTLLKAKKLTGRFDTVDLIGEEGATLSLEYGETELIVVVE
jgi:T5SS/PEP-CTERM-associated repeat protein